MMSEVAEWGLLPLKNLSVFAEGSSEFLPLLRSSQIPDLVMKPAHPITLNTCCFCIQDLIHFPFISLSLVQPNQY